MLRLCEVLLFFGAVALSTGCATSRRDNAPDKTAAQHDSGRAHDALVWCIDTSLSPAPDQFVKMKSIFRDAVARDIQANDLVWLLGTDTQAHPAVLFPFPATGLRRSEAELAKRTMHAQREHLIGILAQFVQAAKVTDVRTAAEYGLNILQGAKRARRKRFVMASDFIQDLGLRGASPDPPPPSAGMSASGVEVILFVARPKAEYLKALHLTATELYQTVSSKWTQYYRDMGAESTVTLLVDAVPVGSY